MDDMLFACWARGNGLGETVNQIKRATGQTLSPEAVRLAFVRFCETVS